MRLWLVKQADGWIHKTVCLENAVERFWFQVYAPLNEKIPFIEAQNSSQYKLFHENRMLVILFSNKGIKVLLFSHPNNGNTALSKECSRCSSHYAPRSMRN